MTTLILAIITLAALPLPAFTASETPEHRQTSDWQEVFAALLRDNYPERTSECGNFIGPYWFLLYDMDLDGVPEMIVLSSIELEDKAAVYTFRDGEAVSLEYGEELQLVCLLRGAARTRIGPAPEGVEGFIVAYTWPTSGLFGTGANFFRVVVDGNRLAIADQGQWYIDLAALHELFENFGLEADENNIYNIIFGHLPELERYRAHIHYTSAGEARMFYEVSMHPYKDNFYLFTVGELWENRGKGLGNRIPWDNFLVREDLSEILWYDMLLEFNVLTLEEWRTSPRYRAFCEIH